MRAMTGSAPAEHPPSKRAHFGTRRAAQRRPTDVPEAYAGTKARVRGVSGEGSATRGTAGPDAAPGRRRASEKLKGRRCRSPKRQRESLGCARWPRRATKWASAHAESRTRGQMACHRASQRQPVPPFVKTAEPRGARSARSAKRQAGRRRWSEGARIPTQERRRRRGRLRPARSFDSARPAGSLRSG